MRWPWTQSCLGPAFVHGCIVLTLAGVMHDDDGSMRRSAACHQEFFRAAEAVPCWAVVAASGAQDHYAKGSEIHKLPRLPRLPPKPGDLLLAGRDQRCDNLIGGSGRVRACEGMQSVVNVTYVPTSAAETCKPCLAIEFLVSATIEFRCVDVLSCDDCPVGPPSPRERFRGVARRRVAGRRIRPGM